MNSQKLDVKDGDHVLDVVYGWLDSVHLAPSNERVMRALKKVAEAAAGGSCKLQTIHRACRNRARWRAATPLPLLGPRLVDLVAPFSVGDELSFLG